MIVQAEISEDGTVKVMDPRFRGKRVNLSLPEQGLEREEKSNWQTIKAAYRKAEQLDFPRRSYDEILRDLREFREG